MHKQSCSLEWVWSPYVSSLTYGWLWWRVYSGATAILLVLLEIGFRLATSSVQPSTHAAPHSSSQTPVQWQIWSALQRCGWQWSSLGAMLIWLAYNVCSFTVPLTYYDVQVHAGLARAGCGRSED